MDARAHPKLLALVICAIAGVAAVALTLRDIRLASSQTVTLVAWRSEAPVPVDDPSAAVWDRAAPVRVPLSAQGAIPPMGGSEGTLSARALHDGSRFYVRLEWEDDREDALTTGQTQFSDAAAVQFPVTEGEQVPAFCMGDPNAPVNIWQWKASWQTELAAGGDALQDGSPDRVVDTYPFEDEEVFYPPQAAGNVPARANRATPIDNLLAGGFGTLAGAEAQMVEGSGEWDDGRWRVVFVRDLTIDGEYTQLGVGERANVAFAVWDGDQNERDGMKSVSTFLTLDVSPEVRKAGDGVSLSGGVIAALIAAGLAFVCLAALGYVSYRRRGPSV